MPNALLSAFVLALALAAAAQAQTWPAKSIRVIVPFSPGGFANSSARAISDRLQTEIARIVQLPDVKEKLAGLGAEAVANTPQEAALFVKTEIAKWALVVKRANIKAE